MRLSARATIKQTNGSDALRLSTLLEFHTTPYFIVDKREVELSGLLPLAYTLRRCVGADGRADVGKAWERLSVVCLPKNTRRASPQPNPGWY